MHMKYYDVDEVNILTAQLGNSMHRVILKKMLRDIDKQKWGVGNKDELLEISKSVKPVIFDGIKEYLIDGNHDVSLESKKELFRQSMINFFSLGDFDNLKYGFTEWSREYVRKYNEIEAKHEKDKNDLKRKRKKKLFSDLSDSLAEDLKILSMEKNFVKNVQNIKINISKNSYFLFAHKITEKICSDAIHDMLHISSFNNNKDIGNENKITENIEIKKQIKLK